tara:strand:- start:1283 stop:1600 length:318 start_codon:yes stop_codon:yes gene_type:complete
MKKKKVATEINPGTKLTLDLKTIGLIVAFTISLATTYFTLQAQIKQAMEEPKPEVSHIEFSYKDELIRATVEGVQLDVSTIKEDIREIKLSLNKMEERLYEISKK